MHAPSFMKSVLHLIYGYHPGEIVQITGHKIPATQSPCEELDSFYRKRDRSYRVTREHKVRLLDARKIGKDQAKNTGCEYILALVI